MVGLNENLYWVLLSGNLPWLEGENRKFPHEVSVKTLSTPPAPASIGRISTWLSSLLVFWVPSFTGFRGWVVCLRDQCLSQCLFNTASPGPIWVFYSPIPTNVSDPHWFQCRCGSTFLPLCGSGFSKPMGIRILVRL